MEFTVFYAWQSDLPNNTNRGLIKTALSHALKKVCKDPNIEDSPRLDHDTKDLPGTPPIAESIYKKIDECGIFVADLTFINSNSLDTSDRSFRQLPNPNVLIELGYAAAQVGWERIVMVFNDHYGSPEDLPFDLRHRSWPLRYTLAPDDNQSRAQVRTNLSKLIERKIREVIESGVLAPTGSVDEELLRNLETDAGNARDKFHDAVRSKSFENLDPDDGALLVTALPGSTVDKKLDLSDAERLLRDRLKPISASEWDFRRGARFFGTIARSRHGAEVFDVTEINDRYQIFAANRRVLIRDSGIGSEQHQGGKPRIVYLARIEVVTVKAVCGFLQLLSELGQFRHYYLGASLINLSPSIAGSADICIHSSGEKVFQERDIVPDLLRIETGVDWKDLKQVANVLRPSFNYFWRSFGFSQSPYYDRSGNWLDR